MSLSNVLLVTFVAILVATGVLVILQRQSSAVAIPLLGGKATNKQPTYIICGPSNSGKTVLFHHLTQHRFVPTVLSQEPNSTTKFPLPSSGASVQEFKLVEFPGHNKLRSMLYDEIKQSPNIHGLIFCLDSTTDPKQLSESAKFLYNVLVLTERRPGGVDVLVACTKNESFSARQPKKIREVMENEIGVYRSLQSSNVSKNDGDNDGDDDDELDLGDAGAKFQFDQLEANVDFIGGSVLKGKTDQWECWIDERSVNF
ncbi:Signal recognition particle receptor subunit beta [Cyberlindnera jadinii NRRL Y-1542]|uniref:Signal recognition particle receptor subunit beta n=1 Tax=Cyberlindnera jadinii (strain ATCC 18201 / CBS 1600 / BCRC 20928 / JCM 3617 / NBRC 0987 / NRRL Y-1542) TaxID=983966 RepID=A0A1E4RYG8_CYBJN|nr:P-loop containing nucleoside triphosphate hydrolase protein [Cyberlindnera jadinii NRRL Y-1542]ODV72317.1 P-loop containing nucleoside triphosphate hydrolase protein [Cyberlindnera jadinii NRRL Y-1542]